MHNERGFVADQEPSRFDGEHTRRYERRLVDIDHAKSLPLPYDGGTLQSIYGANAFYMGTDTKSICFEPNVVLGSIGVGL